MDLDKEIDHECTDKPVCAYCGDEHDDAWEWTDDTGEHECHQCGETFNYEREVSITYSTSKHK